MLEREATLARIVADADPEAFFISGLGFISRGLYAATPSLRERCFYCMGSMGSVLPLALGISLGQPDAAVFALEGDGSLLMNLGALVTLRRYGSGGVRLIVFDNGCYESTGGQPSQPPDFRLEDICSASGLPTSVARHLEQVSSFVRAPKLSCPAILVVKVRLSAPSPRIPDDPKLISERFSTGLQSAIKNRTKATSQGKEC
ncbi:MAG: thiamine pyrophosphate-dependent enzyme [Chloroflexia bacterium]